MEGVDDTDIEAGWPRSNGFIGALGAAIAVDFVSIPIALFVASVHVLKLTNRPGAAKRLRPVPARPIGRMRSAPKAGARKAGRAA